MLIEAARAKINLYLHVVGRRADGFHLLDSLVAFAECGDSLAAETADALSLSIDGPFAESLADEPRERNSVALAARALAAALDRPPAVALRLTKNLPVASGIGGGSADAAAALRLCARAWGINIDDRRLAAIAPTLGADVPACFGSRSAFMGGVGEVLDPAPVLPLAGVVLLNPKRKLSTPEVFAHRSGPFSPPARFAAPPRDARDLAEILRQRRNDLTAPAIALLPAIGDLLALLAASPGCHLVRMSGSGATCFGLYDDAAAAEAAAAWLVERAPGSWIAASRLAA